MHKDKFKTGSATKDYREGWNRAFKRKPGKLDVCPECPRCKCDLEEKENEHDTESVHDTD